MKTRLHRITILALLLCCTATVYAQGPQDHPLVGRIDGSELWHQNFNKIHEYTVITGPMKAGQPSSKIELVGKVTLTQYKATKDNSTFGIHLNYKEFLENNGFEILYSCGKGQCGDGFATKFWELNPVIGNDNGLGPSLTHANKDTEYYISAKRNSPDFTTYVCVYAISGWWDFPVYRVDVIETAPELSDILTTESIEKSITERGVASIYSIHFDHEKAEIKQESEAALKTIAAYLNANKTKRFYIVGHTDNTGDFEANKALSEQRAKAVLKELVEKMGVDGSCLKAYGVASLSPVTSNSTQEGRKRNTRVDLVAQ